MEIQLLDNIDKCQDIRHEWNDLVEKNMDFFNPFLSFEWLSSWWEVFGEGRGLSILIAKSDDDIVGIAPLMISKKTGFKICEFIGTKRSDYLGFILKNKNREEILKEFFVFILGNLKWDLLYFRDYTDSPEELLSIAENQGMKAKSVIGDIAPRLLMEGSWDNYLSGKSSRNRGNIRRVIRKVEANEDIEVTCERKFSSHLIDELAEVEANSWKVETGDPRFIGKGKTFFKTFFIKFSNNKWLEVWTLRYKGKLLSYSVDFSTDKYTYNYNVAFDKNYKQYVKLHSIGSVLTSIALRDSFERQKRVYDFLRGDESYKRLWTNDTKKLSYVAIYKRNPISFLAFMLHFKIRLYLRDKSIAKKILIYFRKV